MQNVHVVKSHPSREVDQAMPNMLANRQVTEIANAVGRLDAKQRVVLSLVYFEELKLDEIAGVLSTSSAEVLETCSAAVNQIIAMLDLGVPEPKADYV